MNEDDRLIVLDKPSGLAVHGGSGLSHGVIEALRAARPDAPYLELVHRLDRETSGCLLIAKRRSALRALHALLREGRVEKRYLALVLGRWELGEVRLEDRLRKTVRGGERVVTVDESGKAAASIFRPVEIGSAASLLEVRIMTGRTHQIRVQAAEAGHPLAGDERYGDRDYNRRMKALGLDRLFLHASSVGLGGSGQRRVARLFDAPARRPARGADPARGPSWMRPTRLVVFDWDGTLMDSTGPDRCCRHAGHRQLGLP
jgi:23S rRNA pseudouridine955/2504/2580 synthase